MAAADTVTKRIHVGGLTPSITPAHIKDRFKSFGDVTQVEDMSVNGLGEPRPFTFFTIQTSPAQLKKCLNIMSGSTWRGCTLRLAEAKLKYDARLEKERNPPNELVEERLRKRKRRILTARGPDMGKEAQDMRVPDEKTYKTKKHWIADNGGHLIRPIAIRPTHALPQPIDPAPQKAGTSKSKGARRLPAKRARIRVIDPSRWHPTHLTEKDLPGSSTREADGWVFESEEQGEEDEDGKILVGRWVRALGGDEEEEEEEEVWVSGKRVDGHLHEDDDADLEELVGNGARNRSASPLFASRSQDRSASPLFGSRPQLPDRESGPEEDDVNGSSTPSNVEEDAEGAHAGPSRSRSASPLFPTRERKSASPLFPTRARDDKSPSPLFPMRNDKPVPAIADEPEPEKKAEVTTSATLPDPMREIVQAEKSRDLGLLASFLGEELEAAAKPTRGEWAGFDEDDDDDDFEYPLRIRGGKADSEDEDLTESSSDSDSDSSDGSDDDEESDQAAIPQKITALGTGKVVASAQAIPSASVTAPSAPPAKPQSALKAMFAPAPAQATFSLLGALDADIELDEELDIPLAPPPVRQAVEPEPELQPLTQTKKSHFDPDPSIPLFFPSFGKGGKDAMREDMAKDGYTGFWRQETDEEMKDIWEKDKVELTRDWKKRYREGKKQKKRRGGANEVE